jgi:flagellar FliJ protein
MARLDPLIKVRKQAVEDKQRVLAELYRQYDALAGAKAQLLADVEREQELVTNKPDDLQARAWFTQFAGGVKTKVADLDALMARLDTRIVVARDDMRAAFAEYKKIEITDRERKKRDQKEIDDKVGSELDAIAIELFRRDQNMKET